MRSSLAPRAPLGNVTPALDVRRPSARHDAKRRENPRAELALPQRFA
jgi:hypothetical protein